MHNESPLSLNDSISDICDQIISQSRPLKHSSRLKQFKTRTKLPSSCFKNQATLELMRGLFDSLNTENDGSALFTDLLDHLISLGVNLDPLIFTRSFKKYFKVETVSNLRVSPFKFHSMLFEDKRTQKIIQILKSHLKPKRNLSILPKITVKNFASFSPKPKFQSTYIDTTDDKVDDYRKLVQSWWNSISASGNDEVAFNVAAQFLIDKQIIITLTDAKKMFGTSGVVSKDDFLAVFCIPIVGRQVLEAAKKINQVGEAKPFLTAYQKLSSVKRKLLISRISPDLRTGEKEYAESVLNGIINFRNRIKSVLK